MFDKETYWKRKRAMAAMSPDDRRQLRRILKNRVVAVHSEPNWSRKPVSAKALRKNTKRARKELAYEQR